MQSLSLLLISCSHLLRASWKLLLGIIRQPLCSGAPWLCHGRWEMKRLMSDLVPGFATQRIPEPLWAGLQGLEIREMPETKLKQNPLFSQCVAEAAACKGSSASPQQENPHEIHNWLHQEKYGASQDRGTGTECWLSARWYMGAELDWNFNSSCNSPQIIITSFIKMKVPHIISTPRAERILMRLSY